MTYHGLTKDDYSQYLKRRWDSLLAKRKQFYAKAGGEFKYNAHVKALKALEKEVKENLI